MDNQQIINELDSIIAYCDLLKEKAVKLRESIIKPPSNRRKTGLSKEAIAKVLADRKKFIVRKAKKANN